MSEVMSEDGVAWVPEETDMLRKEVARAADQALEAIVAFEDDESFEIALRCDYDGDYEKPGTLTCPEYHYWHWLRYCLKSDHCPGTVLGHDDGIFLHFPPRVREGGPWADPTPPLDTSLPEGS